MIGYGGDGNLNAVVNGVLYAGCKSIIGDLPGGSFNEWAGETTLPRDPVKAALALVESVTCTIDLGFFQVEGLTVLAPVGPAIHREPSGCQENEEEEQTEQTGATAEIHEKPKKAGKHRQYFLLHAGLGVDAAIMAHINNPLKYKASKIAFDVAGLKELPRQRPFPVESARSTLLADATCSGRGRPGRLSSTIRVATPVPSIFLPRPISMMGRWMSR